MNYKSALIASLFVLTGVDLHAQMVPSCADLLKQADTLAINQKYPQAALLYFKAFKESPSCKTNSNILRASKICLRAGTLASMSRCLSIITKQQWIKSTTAA